MPFFPQFEIQLNSTSGAVIVKRKGVTTANCPTICPIADGNSVWAQCCTGNGCNNLAIPSNVTMPAEMQQYYAGGSPAECRGLHLFCSSQDNSRMPVCPTGINQSIENARKTPS